MPLRSVSRPLAYDKRILSANKEILFEIIMLGRASVQHALQSSRSSRLTRFIMPSTGGKSNRRGSQPPTSILKRMMVDFKRMINEMRAEGASETEIEVMLDELEACYACSDNAEGKLVLAVLREAACCHQPL